MSTITPDTYEDFLKLVDQGNLVPIIKTIPADLHTPVSAYLKISQNQSHSFLLESISGEEKISRYSFVGSNPHKVIRGRENSTDLNTEKLKETQTSKIFNEVRHYLGRLIPVPIPDLPPFSGGIVGYFAYEAAYSFEKIYSKKHRNNDAVMMFFRNLLVFDHVKQQIKIIVNVLIDGGFENLEERYLRAIDEIEKINFSLNQLVILPSREKDIEGMVIQSNTTKDQFQNSIEKTKEHIIAGDILQLTFSKQFEFDFSCHPFQIYRALRLLDPSPYMFYLNINGTSVMGASSEMLVRCKDRHVESRIISGNRMRKVTSVENELLGAELSANENEVAKHIMYVDLERNNLGKIAEYGSIEIEKLMGIEFSSQELYLISNLKATLKVGYDCIDVLTACFPSVKVSGIHKIPAIKLIKELESRKRGIYGGVVLYLDHFGNLDSCIPTETIVTEGQRAFVQAGVSIDSNSLPEREFIEVVNKIRVLIQAAEIAERDL